MFPRTHRLPLSKKPFPGNRLSNPQFTLIHAPSPLPHYRAAIIISKQVSPKAIVRHQLRRRLAPILIHLLSLLSPTDCLLILKPSATTITQPKLLSSLHSLLSQLPASRVD